MSSAVGNCLYPTLKAAQLLGLLPCTNLRDKGHFRPSKYLIVFTRALFLFLLAPLTSYAVIRDNFKPKNEFGENFVFKICFAASSVFYICFQSFCCWKIIGKSCSFLTQCISTFRVVELLPGVKFDRCYKRALELYQVLGLLVAFSLCMKIFLSFLVIGEARDLQVLLNFIRMQMYVVEQLIVILSLVFAMCYQQLSKCVANLPIKIHSRVSFY